MEKIIEKVQDIKQEVIAYLKDVADQKKLPYLTSCKTLTGQTMYSFKIDYKTYSVEDVVGCMKLQPLETLLQLANKAKKDLNKVMWAFNSHDAKLVDKINECYFNYRQNFISILQLIAIREEIEINEQFPRMINVWDTDDIETFATEILTSICDNKDLECILAFCGC